MGLLRIHREALVLTTNWPVTMIFTYWAATPLITDVIVKATRCANTTKYKLIVGEGVAHYLRIILTLISDWVKYFVFYTTLESESRGADLPRIVYFRVQSVLELRE